MMSFTVLHPGLKLEYFRQHKWEDEWIDVGENLVHEEYAVNYQNNENVLGNVDAEEQRNQVSINQSVLQQQHWLISKYRTVLIALLILLTFLLAPYHHALLIWISICSMRLKMWWIPYNGGMTTAMYILHFIIWH